ncbi:hypothetical protein [Olleya sp. Bg11-27]|uniref:hypothetical protein n=1 Tax=Olleya sp. Bg11-27 TaxID=2058135 RepID=UPI000C304FB9|nr:hypothetical protein [Olleya sp. Bg11-27]AUC75011.1 hypothetical protein CW732_04700 [Olleya sp. Bg11-27]
MKETKWKFKGHNMNFLDVNTADFPESKELLEIIDESKKKELKQIFEDGLTINYEHYKKYLFESNFFMFKDLEDNIKESVHCLIIGSFIASITNTNLILERAIKLALIQYEAGGLSNFDDEKIIEKYIKADEVYSGKSLDKNIQKCIKYNILNSEESQELKEYKLKFRDGFSHFTPKNILKGESKMISIPLDSQNSKMERHLKMPTYQAKEVKMFARQNAEAHLKYVLGIINHLQYKVLEKFKQA